MEHYHPQIIHITKSSKYYIFIRFTMPTSSSGCMSYLSLTFQIEPLKFNIYDVNF